MDFLNFQQTKEIKYRIFIDSGPLMEKDFAFAAGLGWVGKNSLLVHPEYGSFSLLCCIITNVKNDEIPIHCEDLCKDCQLCTQACPTHCISENHTINASRCISYLTIEHKGVIPRDLRTEIGEWVFGCDVCQNVCPHNFTIQIPQSLLFFGIGKKIDQEIDLLADMSLSETAFTNKYQVTPISRASYEQYQRNLIIAAGNSHENSFLVPLKNFLFFGTEILRLHAVWALREIACEDCLDILQTQLHNEKSCLVKKEILYVLESQP